MIMTACDPSPLPLTTRNPKVRVVWGLGSPEVTGNAPFNRVHTTSYLTLIETVCLSCTSFRVIASYLSKVTNFNLTHLHFLPPVGMTSFEFC